MKIRGGHLLARALQQKGVSQVFTLSGGFCNPAPALKLWDALLLFPDVGACFKIRSSRIYDAKAMLAGRLHHHPFFHFFNDNCAQAL